MRWWRFVMASEIRKIMAYRSDFWITFLGQTIVQIIIARALWQSIFESNQTQTMEGFTLETLTLYYLIIPIGSKILTGENIGFLSREIYDGSFNRYLLYPISFFEYKTLTYLTYSLFYGLQLLLIYTLYNLVQYGGMTSLGMMNLSLGVVLFLLASLVYLNMAIFIELISLWADNIWTLMVMLRFLCFFFGGAMVPLNFFPEMFQKVLSYTPFPYLINLPVKTIMGISATQDILTGATVLIFWSVLFRLAAKLLWLKGQYRYTGVGI